MDRRYGFSRRRVHFNEEVEIIPPTEQTWNSSQHHTRRSNVSERRIVYSLAPAYRLNIYERDIEERLQAEINRRHIRAATYRDLARLGMATDEFVDDHVDRMSDGGRLSRTRLYPREQLTDYLEQYSFEDLYSEAPRSTLGSERLLWNPGEEEGFNPNLNPNHATRLTVPQPALHYNQQMPMESEPPSLTIFNVLRQNPSARHYEPMRTDRKNLTKQDEDRRGHVKCNCLQCHGRQL